MYYYPIMLNLVANLKFGFQKFMAYPANILVPTLLFILLSPGVLVSLPEIPTPVNILTLELDSQILTHTAVFGVVYFLLQTFFPQFY